MKCRNQILEPLDAWKIFDFLFSHGPFSGDMFIFGAVFWLVLNTLIFLRPFARHLVEKKSDPLLISSSPSTAQH